MASSRTCLQNQYIVVVHTLENLVETVFHNELQKVQRAAILELLGKLAKTIRVVVSEQRLQGVAQQGHFGSNRADARGSRIDDVLTGTALQDSLNYLRIP